MDHTLAIDFGTSNSSVYLLKQKEEMLPDENGNYLFPSYIEYTQRVVAVGSVARRNLGRSGHFVVACVKRLLGLTYEEYEKIEEKGLFGCEVVRGDDGYPRLVVSKDGKQVTCEEAASELFRAMKKRADTFNSPCVYDQCYLTVPANYKDAQCRAITRAAELAGLKVVKMITEPTAAALSYLLDPQVKVGKQEKMLVYDFGGGTFDASILSYNGDYGQSGISVLGEKGNNRLGGNDVDLAILEFVKSTVEETSGVELIQPGPRARQRTSRLKGLCEDAKLNLTCTPSTEIDLSDLSDEVDCIQLSASMLTSIVAGIVRATIDVVAGILTECELQKGNIKRVFLVGGSSKLAAVRQSLTAFFGPACEFPDVNADHCVSLGAMKLLETDVQQGEDSLSKSLQSSYGIGIDAGRVLLVLRRGMKVPCLSRRFVFSNTEDGQNEVSMTLYRWDGEPDAQKTSHVVPMVECQELYPLSFSLASCGAAGSVLLDLCFSLDFGGSLSVFCYEHKSPTVLFSHTYKPLYGAF